jgi:hypothetical protein
MHLRPFHFTAFSMPSRHEYSTESEDPYSRFRFTHTDGVIVNMFAAREVYSLIYG